MAKRTTQYSLLTLMLYVTIIALLIMQAVNIMRFSALRANRDELSEKLRYRDMILESLRRFKTIEVCDGRFEGLAAAAARAENGGCILVFGDACIDCTDMPLGARLDISCPIIGCLGGGDCFAEVQPPIAIEHVGEEKSKVKP